ncbi:MAG: lipopolysaccharide biosynthesis protein [Sphingobacteriaceae bacterium]|nr:lipopolysaccharide biosynthesis protein [Sphingobacteriaceae bacterium]
MSKTLTDKTISGLNWSFIGNNLMAVINIVVGIILARLLAPQDFGLLGMTYVFIGLAELFVTLGMGSSVQRIKDLTKEHIRVATTITVISSFVVYVIFWFSAPYIAGFYEEERLVSIIRSLSSIFIIQGFVTVSYGQIRRELDFKYILKIDFSSMVLGYGLISSTLAFLDFGVWSLVYGRIASAVISAIIIMLKIPLNVQPLIKKQEFKDLAGFGGGISLSNLIFYASSNVDLLIIGKLLNSHLLGVYTRALNLMKESLTKITGGIYNVLFPAFAAVQDDPQKLKVAYLRTIKTVSYFVYPILISMIVTAEYVIKGLYGVKWEGAITSFQILGLAGILRTSLPYSGALAQATGKVYVEAFQQLIYFLILGGSALFAVKFGIEGIALSILIASLWLFAAQSWLSIRIIASTWKEFFKAMVPGLANLVLMLVVNLLLFFLVETFLNSDHNEIKLLIVVFINAIVFLSALVFMPASIKGDTFEWLLEKYRKFIPIPFTKFYYKFNQEQSVELKVLTPASDQSFSKARLTAVLPIRIDTKSVSSDLDRVRLLLLPSFEKFWIDKETLQFLIIVPPDDKELVEKCCRKVCRFSIRIVTEDELIPDLTDESGWHKQQILKLVAAKIINTRYFITLDSDVVLIKPTSFNDLFSNDKPIFQQEAASKHYDWWLASKKILKAMFPLKKMQ